MGGISLECVCAGRGKVGDSGEWVGKWVKWGECAGFCGVLGAWYKCRGWDEDVACGERRGRHVCVQGR